MESKVLYDINTLFSKLNITNDMTISYHHHLRNGDYVVNLVMEEISKHNVVVNVAASSIFPAHTKLDELVRNGKVNNIYTNYINGPVAKSVGEGLLNGKIYMHTHGGRSRAIHNNEIVIDIAFIAVSECDKFGNANGLNGKSAFGPVGYAISDMEHAKTVVLVCDNLVESVEYKEIVEKYVDYILIVDEIGNPNGIVSGTTQVTKSPIGLKIARDAFKVIEASGLLNDGISFQTGAGGVSLAVAEQLKTNMNERNIKGSFASGGITKYFVDMLKAGFVEELWDVQCFDLESIKSAREDSSHHIMSASKYGNPDDDPIVNKLDIVVLGATEVDINFNVNVITDSSNNLMGGSGGHSDTAYGAKLTMITTPLIKGRLPVVKENVTTITTPGDTVDVIVTERGVAVNPRRTDLIEKFEAAKINLKTIEELQTLAYEKCGVPNEVKRTNEEIGYVVYRDGTIIDTLYRSDE